MAETSAASNAGHSAALPAVRGIGVIKLLTFLMFMMFAMTTDSVGVIIPQIIKTFGLSMAAAGAFQYATMTGIAAAGIGLGFLADRLGRKATILIGLSVFAANSLLFAVGERFGVFLALLFVSGAAIGVFKAGALALVGDISRSSREHTATMNMVEGFFGVGAIIGPALVTHLLHAGVHWKWLYVLAGGFCLVLIAIAALTRYPVTRATAQPADFRRAFGLLRDPFALGFSCGAALYVGVEAAVYVWMPTYLAGYRGAAPLMAAYAISIFFGLRAAGRFLGAWLLARFAWDTVLGLCSLAIFACFVGAVLGGRDAAVFLLPASGLFMSVIYPTLNSKGISCFAKVEHGAAAGLILFFTCLSAVFSPMAMGAIGDLSGDTRSAFTFAAGLAGLLLAAGLANRIFRPTRARLARLEASEY